MTIYAFPINENDNAFGPVTWDSVLSDEFINQIKQQAQIIQPHVGGIVRSDMSTEEVKSIRNVTCRTIDVTQFQYVFDQILTYVHDANKDFFKYDLVGFMESMQYLHYGEDIGGGHYNWHLDCGPGISTRKLTVIVQLSDPSEYEGCDTEIMFHNNVDKRKGAVTIFPSYLPHRVTPLIKGNRDALVAWVNGPVFR